MSDRPEIQRHCNAIHCPDHMKGWEAFGCADKPNEVIVRRLGYGHYTNKPTYGTEKWGPGETHRGVHNIEIMTFADSPASAYIYVNGSTERGTHAAWHRAKVAFDSFSAQLWAVGS